MCVTNHPTYRRVLLLVALLALNGCTSLSHSDDPAQLKQQVTAAEVAFAKTMADRDHAAFAALISEEAVFINGGKPVRGRQAIAADWKKFYDAPRAPFSWRPDLVEVLPSGTLAYSTGPVANPEGVIFARFQSTWRLEAPGVWRVVFDNGTDVCNCPKP